MTTIKEWTQASPHRMLLEKNVRTTLGVMLGPLMDDDTPEIISDYLDQTTRLMMKHFRQCHEDEIRLIKKPLLQK